MAGRTPSDTDLARMQDLARRWFEDIWNRADETAIEKLIAPSCRIYGMTAEVLIGPEGFRPFWELCCMNYRGIDVQIDEFVVDGDWIAVFVSARSLHLHSFNAVEITGSAAFRVEDGRFVESHHVFDYLSVLGRCGAIEDVDAFRAVFPLTEEE